MTINSPGFSSFKKGPVREFSQAICQMAVFLQESSVFEFLKRELFVGRNERRKASS
jgi:hypothetical protein